MFDFSENPDEKDDDLVSIVQMLPEGARSLVIVALTIGTLLSVSSFSQRLMPTSELPSSSAQFNKPEDSNHIKQAIETEKERLARHNESV